MVEMGRGRGREKRVEMGRGRGREKRVERGEGERKANIVNCMHD